MFQRLCSALLLALVLVLSGCGSDESNGDEPDFTGFLATPIPEGATGVEPSAPEADIDFATPRPILEFDEIPQSDLAPIIPEPEPVSLLPADARDQVASLIWLHAPDHHLPFGNIPSCVVEGVVGVFTDDRIVEVAAELDGWSPIDPDLENPVGLPPEIATNNELIQAADAVKGCASFDTLFDALFAAEEDGLFPDEGLACIREAWSGDESHYTALALSTVFEGTVLQDLATEAAVRTCEDTAFAPALRATFIDAGASPTTADCMVGAFETDFILTLFYAKTPEEEAAALKRVQSTAIGCSDTQPELLGE